MRVAIIDCGIDIQKLYGGERHGYEAVWVQLETLTYAEVASCDLVIIPAGSDNTLLYFKRECLQQFLRRGGWVFCFDGSADGLFDGLRWVHTATNYKTQVFCAFGTEYAFLLDGVPLDGLACKDGVRGWWSEGELLGEGQVPLVVDDKNRAVVSLLPSRNGAGVLIATAAGRLPIFSPDQSLASNILFSNLLTFCRDNIRNRPTLSSEMHVYVHSGNWSHRSFLDSERFGNRFSGVHWSCLDETLLTGIASIWIPWESNTRALKDRWPLLEKAVNQGATLIIEDLRDNWLPGVEWHARPVDSSWWREKRTLDLIVAPQASDIFPNLAPRSFFWHYHGVFDGPVDGVPLLTTADGKHVLTLCGPTEARRGHILVSTLDATFEYGAGKILETGEYICEVFNFVAGTKQSLANK